MYGWILVASLVIGIAAWILIGGFVKTWRLYHGVRPSAAHRVIPPSTAVY
jgi:hypothetical protein